MQDKAKKSAASTAKKTAPADKTVPSTQTPRALASTLAPGSPLSTQTTSAVPVTQASSTAPSTQAGGNVPSTQVTEAPGSVPSTQVQQEKKAADEDKTKVSVCILGLLWYTQHFEKFFHDHELQLLTVLPMALVYLGLGRM